jgi:hypothetical protein
VRINRTHKRPLEVSRGPANRDPMFKVSDFWYGPDDTLPVPTAPVEVPCPQWDLAPLPPLPDPQHNDHVMRYWLWRLDCMEKRNG